MLFSRKMIIGLVACLGAAAAPNCLTAASEIKLLNVSYDPTREFYSAFNARFADYYQKLTGQQVGLMANADLSGLAITMR